MAKLKNGSEERDAAVAATMISLKYLWNSGFSGITVISDLLQICKNDPTYRAFGDNEETLKELALLQEDGKPHATIRNIVLSAISGEGLEMTLESPIAD